MTIRLATIAATAALSLLTALPLVAQEEEIYERIDAIHGDADGFFELYSQIQDALLFDTPEALADYVFYPVQVYDSEGGFAVDEPDQLLADFDELVSFPLREAVLGQDIADLIVTDEGVGLGNGALWVTNYCSDDDCTGTEWGIIAFNN